MQDFCWDDLNFLCLCSNKKNRQTIVVKNVQNTGPFNYQLLCSYASQDMMGVLLYRNLVYITYFTYIA